MTQHNNHSGPNRGRAARLSACAFAVSFFLGAPASMAQTNEYNFDQDHGSVDLVIGGGPNSQYINVNSGVTINGGDTFGISAIVLGSGRQDIVNDGTITAAYEPGNLGDAAVYSETTSGEMEIFNSATGTMRSSDALALYGKSSTGSITAINFGAMEGSTINQTWYGGLGVVTLESAFGNVLFENHGSVTANRLQGDDSAVYASTAGSADILNYADINVVGGAGNGIRVASAVTGGTVKNAGAIRGADIGIKAEGKANIINNGSIVAGSSGILAEAGAGGITITNTGSIHAQTALQIDANDVRLELFSDGVQAPQIVGDILFTGQNNSLVVSAHNQTVDGSVTLGINNTLELLFDGAMPAETMFPTTFLAASGIIDVTGGALTLNLAGGSLEVGQSYNLLEADGGIQGWFDSINGIETGGTYDPNALYAIGDYEIKFHLSGGSLAMEVTGIVPEPATVALFLGASCFAAAVVSRKKYRSRCH